MKKVCALGLSLALLFSLAGCMADPTVETPTPGSVVSPGGPSATGETAKPSFANTGMRIALCTSPGTVDDSGHNSAAYNGVLSFITSRNGMDTVTPIQETTGNSAFAVQALEQVAVDYDVLVCVGSAFTGVDELAKAHPEKYFLLVDAEPAGEADNLCAVSYAEQQCGFFAGIAAAMETKTGHIAVINSVTSPANIRYYYGFRSGVAYTNGNFGTTAELVDLPEYAGTASDGSSVGSNYTGSVNDQNAGYAVARDLIAQDCDVLFVAADVSGKGAFTAAKDHGGVWVIGSEIDQFTQGSSGDENVVLTSVTKNMALDVEAQLSAIAKGSFQSGSQCLTAADNALGYVSAADHQQMQEETLKALSDAYPMMQDGTIVPGSGPQ